MVYGEDMLWVIGGCSDKSRKPDRAATENGDDSFFSQQRRKLCEAAFGGIELQSQLRSPEKVHQRHTPVCQGLSASLFFLGSTLMMLTGNISAIKTKLRGLTPCGAFTAEVSARGTLTIQRHNLAVFLSYAIWTYRIRPVHRREWVSQRLGQICSETMSRFCKRSSEHLPACQNWSVALGWIRTSSW